MTESCIRSVVEAIHSSPFQAVLHLAGGASQVHFSLLFGCTQSVELNETIVIGRYQVVGSLLSVPGASNTVLEVVVPYSKMSLIQLLGKVPSFSSYIPISFSVSSSHWFCSCRFHPNFVANRLLKIWLYWRIIVLLSSPSQVH